MQIDVILGLMLSSNTSLSKGNGYFLISQKESCLEYITAIKEVLQPFFSPTYFKRKKHHVLQISAFQKDQWYNEENGKKVIPTKWLKLSSLALSHWYVNDGYNIAQRKRIVLTTRFTFAENEFLGSELLRRLGIRTTLHRDMLTVWQRDYAAFLNLVKPHIPWKCFQYKLDTTKMPVTKSGWGAHKLSLDQVAQIRYLYFNDRHNQTQLAQQFGVSRKTVHLIVNNKIYKFSSDMGMYGAAEVYLTYNYNPEMRINVNQQQRRQ